MKKITTILFILTMLIPFHLSAQSYKSLWNEVEKAENDDMPRTGMEVLEKIIKKAEKEKAYGHWLMAQMHYLNTAYDLDYDSLAPNVALMEARHENLRQKDPVMSAVHACMLGMVYQRFSWRLGGDKSQAYFDEAMSDPALLARHKASELKPFIAAGKDSKWYNDDLLSLVGMTSSRFQKMHDYYKGTSLRSAACLSGMDALVYNYRRSGNASLSETLSRLDSLAESYSDLEVAGEVAVQRYELMERGYYDRSERIQYINYALGKWGKWPRTNILRNEYEKLTQPYAYLDVSDNVILPHQEKKVRLNDVRNVHKVTVKLTRTTLDGSFHKNLKDNEKEVRKACVPGSEKTWNVLFSGKQNYEDTDTTITLPPLESGVYLIEMSTDNKKMDSSMNLLRVSDLLIYGVELPGDTMYYGVVSATTGQPVPGARVEVWKDWGYKDERIIETITCDAKGSFRKRFKESYLSFRPVTDTERYALPGSVYSNYYDNQSDAYNAQIQVFTDRSLYRPGQKVYAAAICYKHENHDQNEVAVGKRAVLTLHDVNGKILKEETLTTDEYGVVSTTFELPENTLTGRFRVKCSYNGRSSTALIGVEEYKRPTFRVEFPAITQEYENGDTIQVKGHALSYAGVPVQGAKVEYVIKRQHAWWWWSRRHYGGSYNFDGEEIKRGTAITDGDGAFVVDMPMVMPKHEERGYYFYNIVAEAKVTDQAGETREGRVSAPVSGKKTMLDCSINGDRLLTDTLHTVTFTRLNMAGTPIDGDVTYYIDGDESHPYHAPANKPMPLKWEKKHMASGAHKLKAVCGDDEIERKFTFFSLKDKAPVEKTHDWFYVTADTFPRDGGPVTIQMGSSDPNVYAKYFLISEDKILEEGELSFDQSLVTRELRYKPEYGQGVLYTVAWVKEGELYRHSTQIYKPLPIKDLKMEWVTFRDRLTPGQDETWTLRVLDQKGKPAAAQLMATLYDQSLEQLRPHRWYFSVPDKYYVPTTTWDHHYRTGGLSARLSQELKILDIDEMEYTAFDGSLDGDESVKAYGRGGARRMKNMTGARLDSSAAAFAEEAPMVDAMMAKRETTRAEGEDETGKSGKSKNGDNVQVRENMDETAFFMPALTTNSKGEVQMRFRLPDCVTTWQFMGLAHDKELNHQVLRDEAVAKKEVMVMPNMPRFIREGDAAQITTRIVNTAEKDVSGKCVLTLLDPETEKEVYRAEESFSVSKGSTTHATFNYCPTGDRSLLICRIVATGKGYSDGEQHYLPILPSVQEVLNTQSVTMHHAGVETIDVQSLFPAGTGHQQLTVEYTNNPAWLVVQAMPQLATNGDDCAITQAVAYFVNAIGKKISKQVPGMKAACEAWLSEEEGNKDGDTTMKSNLEKNQDVKSVVLDETPWVSRALSESNRRHALIDFFDTQKQTSRERDIIEKLRALQQGDGLFTWWPGMLGSEYVTSAVCKLLVRSRHMTAEDSRTTEMLDKAAPAMYSTLSRRVKEMKKWSKENKTEPGVSDWTCDLLYTLSMYNEGKWPANMVADRDYMLKLLSKSSKGLTIYGKANIGTIFLLNGQEKEAQKFVKSIREYTVMTEEKGRFFNTHKAQYTWQDYRIPSQVAAIEAMTRITPDDQQTISELQRWLLQEKRTTMWSTNLTSAEAVYAFVLNHLDAFVAAPSEITVDGRKIEGGSTALIGYTKERMSGEGVREVRIEKQGEGTSWGAVYAQFTQDIDKIESSSTGISVTREVLGDSHAVGDKVRVRITIECDRDYDFVQVIDHRAACMEPVEQYSGYRRGCYVAPRDRKTEYFFDRLGKGRHVIETEYYIDRAGNYQVGTCEAQCAYSPEFAGRSGGMRIEVK